MTQSAPEKSIAVLPFENLSEEKANAYFADGIQEEILTRLAKIADLKVISRTSTQKYKSSPDNLREIAQQLGVANILEGSVQKAADQVRVNVQLVNAQTDSHLRSVELTGATGALPHAPTESVGRQNCQPNITVEKYAHAAGREFPLPSDRSFSAGDRTSPARAPIHSRSKTGSHIPALLDHPEDVGFLRSIRSCSRVKLISARQPPQSAKCI